VEKTLGSDVGRLTDTYRTYILVNVKTTLNIDDGILAKASRLTGVKEKTSLVRMGLEALIARYSAQRLAALGGSEPNVKPIPRRRTA
jgi:Arc/MetJ family transcription regulator